MKMDGRSRRKNIKAARRKNEDNKYEKPESLTLPEVLCTVCMGIFIEPVTLPCYHTVCKVCFQRTIDNNILACPMCRKYVGAWVRRCQKNGLMVNQALWSYINQHFEPHVQKKLKGEDDEVIDGFAELNIPIPRLSEPGLIGKEFEAEHKRIQEEALKQQELEARASEQLIQELQDCEEEERKRLEELRRKAEEEDALIAQQVAAQLEAEDAQRRAEEEANLHQLLEEEEASSAFVRLPSQSTSLPRAQPLKKGPMDIFLQQNNLLKPSRTGSSSSTDSLRNELHHFRPVHYVPTTPPKSSPDGTDSDRSPVCKPIPIIRNLDGWSSPGTSSITLRPWLQKDCNTPSTSESETNTPLNRAGTKRPRSFSNVTEKMSPKRTRRESPRKTAKPQSVQTKLVPLSGKQRNSNGKRLTLETALDSNADSEGEIEHYNGFGNASRHGSSNNEIAKSCKPKHPNGLVNVEGILLPLSLHDLSENSKLEERYRQEQEDFQFALQLQKKLDATESQHRTYELRSVGPPSPKKNQPKIVTPRRKMKIKPVPNSAKEKRRQCTLEESMSFSVKMEL